MFELYSLLNEIKFGLEFFFGFWPKREEFLMKKTTYIRGSYHQKIVYSFYQKKSFTHVIMFKYFFRLDQILYIMCHNSEIWTLIFIQNMQFVNIEPPLDPTNVIGVTYIWYRIELINYRNFLKLKRKTKQKEVEL